ncbi:MAG: YndJ family transporter, partial [Verrucomicrobiaceae bacterium]|nr:YndJ family transporter [Verrucomicrobiaceae bacterium]
VAILAGVPLVALGITCTHFGVLRFVEPFGVTVLVLGALGVAVSQIRRGIAKQGGWLVRAGFVVSGASLLAAMLLAMGFGLRHLFPNLALTMPQMWMIHGTLNAFGFGLCGLLAWRAVTR